MRHVPRRFYALAAVLITLNAAGLLWIRHELTSHSETESHTLRLSSVLPAENVDQTERLSLVFNRPVGEPADLNDQLRATPLFDISPRVSGAWQWSTPSRLDFILDDPLLPGRKFRIEPTSDIEMQLGQVVQIDHEIEFQTRPLKLEACRLVSSDDSHVTFELKFNQPVEPHEALKSLKLSDGPFTAESVQTQKSTEIRASDPFELISLIDEASESIVLRCRRPASEILGIELNASLAGRDAQLTLGSDVREQLKITPRFAFLRAEVGDLGIDRDFQVELYFTAAVDSDQRLPAVKIDPPVKNLRQTITGLSSRSSQRLRMQGEFEAGQRYKLRIPETLLARSGETLGDEVHVILDIPDRQPRVELAAQRGILSPHGDLILELRTLNVGSVKVRASRIHRNNLVPHLHGQWKRRTSVALAEKAFAFEHSRNEELPHALDLATLLEKPSGVYQVAVDATDARWTRDSAVVTITDLGLTLRQQSDHLHVWVTSLRHAQPMSQVRVSSISYNNQVLATGTTNEDGLVALPVDRQHSDGLPWVIVAERDDQIAWLRTDQSHWVIDNVDQSGRSANETYDVLLYPDRGTYRPGDLLHMTGIIRDHHGAIPQPFPLELRVIRPDGLTLETLSIQPSADSQGTFHVDWQTSPEAWTGAWRFELSVPGDSKPLAETFAYVEQFLPVRLEVDAHPNQELVIDGQPQISVAARYLFGTPASELQVQVVGEYRSNRFHSETFPELTFGPLRLSPRSELDTITTRLDESGTAKIDLADLMPDSSGCWRGVFTVTVTEDGGRSVSTRANFDLDTLQRHLGLRLRSGSVVAAKSDCDVEWALRSATDEPAEFAPITLELVRVDFDNVMRRSGGRVTWESIERTETVWNETVEQAPDGPLGHFKISCPNAGLYRLIAIDSMTGHETVLQFRAVSATDRTLNLAMNRPELLSLDLDRKEYRPGETAQVVVNSPFAGALWLCLESDRVLWSTVVTLQQNTKVVEVPIPRDIRGGAYLSGSVLRPVDPRQQKWLPHRARGMAHIKTDHSDRRLPIELTVPPTAAPGESIEVSVSTQPGAMVQLWAVDEGILATSDFSTPDPHGHYFGRRRNQVTTSDVFDRLLPDHQRPDSFHRIGGDREGLDRLRRNPVPTRQQQAAVLWQPFEPVDSTGQLVRTFVLPRMSGQLRWMAVAVRDDHYAAKESPLTVTAPLLVETSWPRFAAPQDKFRVPARVFNTSRERLDVSLNSEVTGPLSVSSEDVSVSLQPGETHTFWLQANATGLGSVEGVVRVQGQSETGTTLNSLSRFALPIRSATALETERQFLVLHAGQSHAVPLPERFMSDMSQTRVILSPQAGLDLQPAVDQLLHYPHGCAEQTTSRLRGILAAQEWLDSLPAEEANGQRRAVPALVDAGINRLWSMQTRTGGLSYWPGSHRADLWSTIYAVETLLNARDQGFTVDPRLLSSLTEFLEQSLQQPNLGQRIDPNVVADLCCVLARLDQPPIGWMSRLTERIDDLDMAARAQLSLAWINAGRRPRVQQSLPADTIDLPAGTSYQGRFVSKTIGEARLLNALVEIDQEHEWIPQLVARLHQSRRDGRWLSTLENAMALQALSASRAAVGGGSDFEGQVTINNREVALKTGDSHIVTLDHGHEPIAISATGAGQIAVSIATTGLTKKPPAARDRVIEVRRRWLDRHGNELDSQNIRVGDLIIVELTLRTTGSGSLENIAIVDALPAGLEVENPRLRTSDQSAAETGQADRVEFLDDRVVLFTTAQTEITRFKYALRSITAGEFTVPPIQAACMYNESIESLSGGGHLSILDSSHVTGPVARDPDAPTVK